MVKGLKLAVGLAGSTALLIGAAPAPAATIAVGGGSGDEFGTGGQCALREAIQAINNGADFDNCTLASGSYGTADTIQLPVGTIQLTLTGVGEDLNATGDLDVRKPVTIVGMGDSAGGSVIDANHIDRAIDVRPLGAANNLSLQSLVLENGQTTSDGGGVRAGDADGTVTVTGATINGNHAGGEGGAISRATATSTLMTITQSEIIGNSAGDDGGAIYRTPGSCLGVNESLLSGNSTEAEGGAVYLTGSSTDGNCANFRNTTLSGNSAAEGGGALGLGFSGSNPKFTFATIAGNSTPLAGEGGAIRTDDPTLQRVEFQGTILAGNTAGGVDAACAGPGIFVDNTYNLETANTCHLVTASPKFSLINTDPLLAPLADNGGPTRSRGLYDTSPAIDRVPLAQCGIAMGIDQRLTPRPMAMGMCDVGAFEGSVGPAPPPPPPPAVGTVASLTPAATSGVTPRKKCKRKKKRAAAAKKKKCKRK